MILTRVLSAELLKLRRTLAFWMVLIAPLVVLLLTFLMFHQRSAYFAKQGKPLWDSLQRNAFTVWAILMLPMYIALQSSLLAAIEHGEDRWRNLLALPVPRWALYAVKLAIPCAMVFVSSAALNLGALGAGSLLEWLKPELRFPAPLPWGAAWNYTLYTMGSALFIITLQQWVSLRFPAFAASAGFGVCGTVVGFVLINSSKYGPWWPWCLPAQMMVAKAGATEHALWYSAAGALAAALAGGIEFCRRDVHG